MPFQKQTARDNELPEHSTRGPFGGIQSEVPLDFVEQLGFADAINVMFRKASAYSRPGIVNLSTVTDPILGVFDFYTLVGDRVQVIITDNNLLKWDSSSQSFTTITGTLTGATNQLFTADVVGGKLYFCQGLDKVQMWDGISGSFADAAAAAVPAKYLFELGFHLLAMYTIESGPTVAPQRVRWTGAGDGTDWTSFSSGQADLFNNLGPITGGAKLYQQGYIWQQWGITQVQLTGVGLAPFAFFPLGAKAKGNTCPYSLATFGEDIACYVGKNDIYRFDGSYSTPIGSLPIDGNRRVGARKRIFADLKQCNPLTVFGLLSTSDNGNDYSAYWIFMPELKSAWVFHFDEGNWTRFTFDKIPSRSGEFNKANVIRIMDLVGTINDQLWFPATLLSTNPLDSLLIGFTDGTPGEMDFSSVCEQQAAIKSGQCTFGDLRHEHTIKKFRIVQQDFGTVTLTLTVVNEKGQTVSQTFTIGNGSGLSITRVVEFSIPGRYLTWTLTCPAGQQLALSEIAPIYDVGGEVRGGL